MMIPTVHLNGTSKGELIRQCQEANHAIREALKALQDAAPHGRDYYVQESGAFVKAQDQHIERMRKLQSVIAELEEIAEGIWAQ